MSFCGVIEKSNYWLWTSYIHCLQCSWCEYIKFCLLFINALRVLSQFSIQKRFSIYYTRAWWESQIDERDVLTRALFVSFFIKTKEITIWQKIFMIKWRFFLQILITKKNMEKYAQFYQAANFQKQKFIEVKKEL